MMNPSFEDADKPKTLVGLGAGERLFIWGFRAVAQHSRLGWPNMQEMRQVCGHFGVADAVACFDSMLEVFACTAHSAIELHCPGCPCVSDSETKLLQAVSAAQRGNIEHARRLFEQWLPEIAADWIMAPVRGLVTIFSQAGLSLPARSTKLSLIDDTMKMRSWPVGSPTLH